MGVWQWLEQDESHTEQEMEGQAEKMRAIIKKIGGWMMCVTGSEEWEKGKARLEARRFHRQRLMFPVAGKVLRLVHVAKSTRFVTRCCRFAVAFHHATFPISC